MRKILNSNDYVHSGDFGSDTFKNGFSTFAYTIIGDAYDYYRNTDIIYGFLPPPKLDELQEDYISCCTDMLWAMPKTLIGEAAERSATIIEAFQCYNYNYMLPEYLESALKARLSDSPDDSEMLQIIADTRAIAFAYIYELPINTIVNDCVFGNQQVASYFKANQKSAQNKINSLVEKFAEME